MAFIHSIDPVFFSFGPLQIRYYGLIYFFGFILAYFLIYKVAKEKNIPLTKDDVADYLTYILIGDILGARLFEVLFYEPAYYFTHLWEIFAVWKGGLSFHGGLVGVLLAAYLYSKKKKVSFLHLTDLTVIPAAFGLFLGRIANFINGELYGKITSLPWGVQFQNADGFRHPTQIYESLKNLFIFCVLWSVRKKSLKEGTLTWLSLFLYGTIRFFIEFLKDPSQIGGVPFGLTIGQWLSLPMAFIGAYMLWKNSQKYN